MIFCNYHTQRFLDGSRIALYRSLLGCLLLGSALLPWDAVQAQSNFTPLQRGDIEEREDRWAFSPGIQLSGDYRFRTSYFNSNDLQPRFPDDRDPDEWVYENDLRIRMRSTVHRNASINLEIETRQGPVQEADLRDENSTERTLAPDSQISALQARQAYLEYNTNPHNILKIGKHYINIGEHRGKVFAGVLTGVSHDCRLGTWCYELGAMKAGRHAADWIYYGSLEYPVFQEKTPEGSHHFTVEIFRVFYTERNIPLGISNAPTFRDNDQEADVEAAFANEDSVLEQRLRTQSRQVFDRDGNLLYYDAIGQEYFGIRLEWVLSPLEVHFDLTANQGKRRYHLLNEEGGPERPNFGEASSEAFKTGNRAEESVAALASELDVKYRIGNHRFGFRWMFASGTKEKPDPEITGRNFLRTLHNYYEIVPGSYRGTNFYFNGGEQDLNAGTGLGHSISNTSLWGGWYSYTVLDWDFTYRVGIFKLDRVQPVINELGKEVEDIGLEVDNTFAFILDKHVKADIELNFFQARDAFTFEDNEVPVKSPDGVFHVAGRIVYSF